MFTVDRELTVNSVDPLNPSSLPFPQIEGGQSFMLVPQRTPVKPVWQVQLKALTMSVQVPEL